MEKKKAKTTKDIAKEGKFDPSMMGYYDSEEIGILKENANEETKKEIEEFVELDINEVEIAFKNLKEAIENNDLSEHDKFNENPDLVFRKFEFWLALRQIPIKIAKLYMFMGRNQGLGIEFDNLTFKNSRFRSHLFLDEKKLDHDYDSYSDFLSNPEKYTL